jgi:glycosyltransferase involved in cell wall biosynthesis
VYRILSAHNNYQQRGGEDGSCLAERELLTHYGNHVSVYDRSNWELVDTSVFRVGLGATWSQKAYRDVCERIRRDCIDLVHVQNFFPLISPSIFYAAKKCGVPVILTLRNYRLLCANGLLFRDGEVCTECLGARVGWRGVRYGCYRGSRLGSLSVVGMNGLHGLFGTWRRAVDGYITLTSFSKGIFCDNGLPRDKIFVKPNFLSEDPGVGGESREGVIFVGRLSEEKGIRQLLGAWEAYKKHCPESERDTRLIIVGGGPLRSVVEAVAKYRQDIEVLGELDTADVLALVGRSRFLVFPSTWYEGMPRTIIESFAKGTPVLAYSLGAMKEMVRDGETGVLCQQHTEAGLSDGLSRALAMTKGKQIYDRCRADYEKNYTASANYRQLIGIYDEVISARRTQGACS